jgi:catechol 2,3-dioxygenase-like lactoylglutathione lyase family enzyme
MTAPVLSGVLETGLYVDDVPRSARFYREVFGLETLVEDDRFCALSVAGRQLLLLFKKGGTTQPLTTPGGVIPPHDGSGHTHYAFAIPTSALAAWEERLRQHGVGIESRVSWPRGGVSLYFRDPDGHLGELATPGVWAIY